MFKKSFVDGILVTFLVGTCCCLGFNGLCIGAFGNAAVVGVDVILAEVLIGTLCCLGFKLELFVVVLFRSVFSVVGVVPPSAIVTTPPRLKFESGTSSSLSSSISRSSTSKGTSSGIVASSLLPI